MGATLERLTIPGGDAGARRTLDLMRRVVRQSLANPIVRSVAASIALPTMQRDKTDQARAIRRYLQDHIRFLPDPVGVELLHTPEWMLREIQQRGIISVDCDDAAILGAALALNIGIRAEFIAVAFNFPNSPFQHVYTVLTTPQGKLELDTTRPYPLPRPSVTRVLRMEV